MMTRLPGASIAALTVAALILAMPALCAPVLQQMAQSGATELVIYTGSSKAVVRQQSAVRLSEGANTVGFEWATDSLDAASIRLHGGEALTVGEVSRPAGQARTLQWSVVAPQAGNYALTTSFLLSGLKWSADYRLVRSPQWPAAMLSGWITVSNESGLDLQNVRASLVLGRSGAGADGIEQAVFPIPELRELPRGASVRAVFLRPIELPVWTIHRIDAEAAPERVAKLLEVQPPTEGALARTSLPSGPMSVLDPGGVVRTTLSYEPGESFEVALGNERDITVKRRLLERKKSDVQFDRVGQVSGLDTTERYEVAVRSHLGEAIEVEMLETVLATWEIKADAPYVLEDGTAELRLGLPARGESVVQFTIIKHSGTRIPK